MKPILILTIGGAIISALFFILALFKIISWWLFLWLGVIIPLIIILLIILIKVLLKKSKTKEKEKPKLSQEKSMEMAIDMLKTKQYAEQLINPQHQITHEGREGTEKATIFHLWGMGYWTSLPYYVLINMEDQNTTILIGDTSDAFNNKEFKQKINEAINKLAPQPATFETIKREESTDPFTGRPTVKVTKKKQTAEEKRKEDEEKQIREIEALE